MTDFVTTLSSSGHIFIHSETTGYNERSGEACKITAELIGFKAALQD